MNFSQRKTAKFPQISVPERINCGLLLEAESEAEAKTVRPRLNQKPRKERPQLKIISKLGSFKMKEGWNKK